eukprot:TRINITY_DN1774_c0_g1_i16.p1 TRINITY_DN1774_c0_g1~~TRINITY_DN1774_c0_g1_i16.p1  ORF type:complete len:333 (+),score=14.00 TRINITY_DN1774_c0_g1_i16:350-1348(+)
MYGGGLRYRVLITYIVLKRKRGQTSAGRWWKAGCADVAVAEINRLISEMEQADGRVMVLTQLVEWVKDEVAVRQQGAVAEVDEEQEDWAAVWLWRASRPHFRSTKSVWLPKEGTATTSKLAAARLSTAPIPWKSVSRDCATEDAARRVIVLTQTSGEAELTREVVQRYLVRLRVPEALFTLQMKIGRRAEARPYWEVAFKDATVAKRFKALEEICSAVWDGMAGSLISGQGGSYGIIDRVTGEERDVFVGYFPDGTTQEKAAAMLDGIARKFGRPRPIQFKMVRDKATNIVRNFGFMRFASEGDALAWVGKPVYPLRLDWPAAHGLHRHVTL